MESGKLRAVSPTLLLPFVGYVEFHITDKVADKMSKLQRRAWDFSSPPSANRVVEGSFRAILSQPKEPVIGGTGNRHETIGAEGNAGSQIGPGSWRQIGASLQMQAAEGIGPLKDEVRARTTDAHCRK